MTREELYRIVSDAQIYGQDPARTTELILAALAREREGEVVLDGNCCLRIPSPTTEPILLVRYGEELYGKRGQLIFRPAKGDR